MNVAILIGNSDYENENKLPACKNDLEVIGSVIKSSGKYDEIFLYENYKSIELKNGLSDRIKSLENSAINEMFIYYTGHGLYKENQFFYIPIDYSQKKHNVTSLANEEFDNLIRSLSPQLTIKVIDACESSQTYIKMLTEEKEKYLKETKKGFSNCYFMFSSQNNQSSYQDSELSYFTRAFYESLFSHESNSIRYKDISSYIADFFAKDDEQTPFFITQANFTEIFIDNLSVVKSQIGQVGKADTNTEPKLDDDNEKLKSLATQIMEDSKCYLDKETALNYLGRINSTIEAMQIHIPLQDFYDLKISPIKEIKSIVGIEQTFKEIESQKKEWFIDIETENEEYEAEVEVPKRRNPKSLLWSPAFDLFNAYQEYDLKTVTRTRQKIVGFEHSLSTPISGFSVSLVPKFPNLEMNTCNLFFIFNKKDFMLFNSIVIYKDKNWGQWIIKEKSPWQKRNFLFSEIDSITSGIEEILIELQDGLFEKIKKHFVKGEM